MKIMEPAKSKTNVLLLNIEHLTRDINHTNGRDLVKKAHECEDVIDDIIYKIAYERRRKCSFLKRYISKPFFHLDPQNITKRLDKAKGDIEKALQLKICDEMQKHPSTTSYRNKLVGLNQDIDSLVEKLTRDGNEDSVLYIVGKRGSGKTTLATELTNHKVIKKHFKSMVWVPALQEKDAKGIFLEILKKTQGKEEGASKTTEELVYKISNILGHKSYIIIIDDVKDPDNLATHMFPTMQHLNHRSKIVITTCATPRHPYMHEEYIVSPDEDVDSLAKNLTKKKIHETSIFYMPAKQATTLLLTSLYQENERLKEHFGSRTWVYIDEKQDERSILHTILKEIKRDTSRDTSKQKEIKIDELVKQIEDLLAKNSSLIVLDQMQETKGLAGHLHGILKNTSHRSKVIFMTNNPPTHPQENEECIAGEELLDADLLITRLIGEGKQPFLFSIRDLDNSGCNTDRARELYNHQTVKQHFEQKFWITIHREGGAAAALSQIIRHIGIDSRSIKDPSTQKLAEQLIGDLVEKRYLLVLENMVDSEELVFDLFSAQSDIKTHKREGAFHSKIIITVGNPRTLRHSNLRYFLYEMRPLSEEESRTLLCSIVFNHAKGRPNIDHVIDQFEKIPHGEGEMSKRNTVLKNCNGIPLAIVVLGGLLSTRETIDEWETVSTSLSKETQSDQALENILLLCYHDLPGDIIPCFLYFSLFPQDYEIPTGMLIRMWLAEGLVRDTSPGTQPTLENVAAEYLKELACRCLIQVTRRNHIGEIKNICLHNKIHQLSVTKSAELGFLENYPFRQNTATPLLRRATIHPGKFNGYPMKRSKLRTLVIFGRHGLSTKNYYFQHEALSLELEPIHEHFRLLRVLILCGIRASDTLPERIGDLTFLTYLGLRATSVKALPETIQNLRKLIPLDYRGSLNPITCKPLPDVLLQMTKLRHVYLPEYAISSTKNLNLKDLKDLQILWGVSGGNWLTADLAKLTAPLVKLGIVNISCNEELKALVNWLNMEHKQLEVLKLHWHKAGQDELLFPDSLNKLPHLRKLILIGRLKEEFNFRLLPSLVKLELSSLISKK